MTVRPVGAHLFHTVRQQHIKLLVTFRNLGKAPKCYAFAHILLVCDTEVE